jgi:AcrR family transcriptional regulator
MTSPLQDGRLLRRIFKTVFTLVAEEGVDGASLRKVAAATGLTTGTLNYHFGNRQVLLLASLDYAYHPPHDWSWHAVDPRQSLTRLTRRYVLDKDDQRAWWRFWCAMTAHAPRAADLSRRQTENQQTRVAFFRAVLQWGVDQGNFTAVNPETDSERLVAFAHGLALRQLVDPSAGVVASCCRLLTNEIEALA